MDDARQPITTWEQGGLTPALALQVFGMRRSGNHAIIDWLMRNAPAHASGGLFYNNCKPGRDPRRDFATVDVYGPARTVVDAVGRPVPARLAEAGDAPMVLVSYEDRMPPEPGKGRNPSKGFETGDFDHVVIIYRSFLNWAASLLAKLQRNADWGAVDRLRIMSRAFTDYAEGLDRLGDPGVVSICYDRWMTDERYREELLAALGLPQRDNTRGKVQRFGGGSSFQANATDAADLKTVSRADQMADNPEFQLLIWFASHDLKLMERVMPHFREDVERMVRMAETARFDMTLPQTGVNA